ncbi:MAG: ABC transporter substrate-binding protein, partial [Deltaproteobacteria bacterium]|nr:ABC transporter substrate-binding protein [Deltaproteobacteria bacterium]
MKKILIILCAVVFLLGLSSMALAKTIKIGGIMDTTGATSDVGKDYAIGMAEAFHYINDAGGVNGKKIKYTWFDYGYRIPEALTKYKLLKRMKVLAIMGWGTGDTEALSPTVNKDKMPYVSASYSAHLTSPVDWVDKEGRKHGGTAYNLFFSSDYSTNARACLTAWYDKKWKPRGESRKPRLSCSYM